MVTTVYSAQDTAFVSNHTQDYNLSLLIGTDRLSYLIFQEIEQKLLCLKSYAFDAKTPLLAQLDELMATDPLLSAEFKHREIILHTRRFSIVPDVLFEEASKELYLSSILPIGAYDRIYSDKVEALQAHLVYALNSDFSDWLQTKFAQQPHCISTGIINATLLNAPTDEYYVLGLWQSRSFHLTILYKGQLILHQVYPFYTAEDCLYYVLLAYRQLGLSREKQLLFLGGDLVPDSEIYKMLHIYIRNIAFVERPTYLKNTDLLKKIPAHFYYDLFSTLACASSAES